MFSSRRKIRKTQETTMFSFFTLKNFLRTLFLGIGLFVMEAYSDYKTESVYQELETTKLQLSQLESTNQDNNQKLQKAITILDSERKKHQRLEHLLKDLDRCKNPVVAFSIGFSESRCKYNVTHPTSDLTGIGGIKPKDWGHYLAKKKVPINSLQAIDAIYLSMLKESKHDKNKALRYYKGTKTKDYSYKITTAYINKIKQSKDFKFVLESHRNNTKTMKELGLA